MEEQQLSGTGIARLALGTRGGFTVCFVDRRWDMMKLDVFVSIRRRQIPLALICLNEVCVYSGAIILHMVLIQ